MDASVEAIQDVVLAEPETATQAMGMWFSREEEDVSEWRS